MNILKKMTLPKNIAPKFERLFIHIAFVLASSYIAVTQVFTKHVVGSSRATTIKDLFATLIVALSLYVLLFLASRFFEERELGIPSGGENARNGYMFLVFFLIAFAFLMVAFFTFFPGGFSVDNNDQWKEVQSGVYTDQHPALQTIFIKLASLFWNDYTFVVFLQNLFVALAIAYLFYTLYKYNVSRLAIWITFFLVVLNTSVTAIVQHLWKDCSLIIFITVLTGQLINLYFSKGKWLDFRLNRISFAVILACTTIMRHNAMFFTLPLACILLYTYVKENKKIIRPIALALALFLLVQGPLYSKLGVEKNDDAMNFQESIGAQMVVLMNVYQKKPDALPAEAVDFMERYVPQKEWETNYSMGDYNSIKWRTNWEVLDDYSPKDMLRWTAVAIVKAPVHSFEAFRELTKWVWSIDEYHFMNPGQLQKTEPYEIAELYKDTELHQKSSALFNSLRSATSSPTWEKRLIYSYGAQQLLLVLCGALSLFRKRRFAFMFVLPTLVHNIATMFLLSSYDKRFYQFNTVIILPMCLVLLTRERRADEMSGMTLFGELGSIFSWASTVFTKIDRSFKKIGRTFGRTHALESTVDSMQSPTSTENLHIDASPILVDEQGATLKEPPLLETDIFFHEGEDPLTKADKVLAMTDTYKKSDVPIDNSTSK